MESRVGSILLLISAIITFIVALVALLLMFVFLAGEGGARVMFFLTLIAFIFLLISGGVKLYASRAMRNPRTTTVGGIVAIIVGVLNGFDLIAVVGGIIGIVDGEKKNGINGNHSQRQRARSR